MSTAVIAGVFTLVGATVSSMVSGWLSNRTTVAADLRTERLGVYPKVWKLTAAFSRWPRTDVRADEVAHLHEQFRTWYFVTGGGLYMSTNARKRYGEMQQLLDDFASSPSARSPEALGDAVYVLLMDAASAVRTALTEDLSTRERPSLLLYLGLRRSHRAAEKEAAARADAMREHACAGAVTPVVKLDRTAGAPPAT